MREVIIRAWKGEPAWLRRVLYPLLLAASMTYSACLMVRELLYRRGCMKVSHMPIPVISVGNITLGGTGKTPVVERLSLRLKEGGFSPAIVTRGYRRRKEGIFQVNARKDSALDVGDEAFMLSRKTGVPVIVGADRAQAIRLGMKEQRINVAILDDGFQRRDIGKDIEILVLKGGEAAGGLDRRLFPLGSLREPLERVRDADIIVVNKGEPDGETRKMIASLPVFPMSYRPLHLVHMRRNRIGSYPYSSLYSMA